MKITVQDKREEALLVGFEAMRPRLPEDFDFATFRERLEDWRVRAFCDGEHAVGMLMTRGAELHVAVLPEVRGKWLSRRLIREVFAPILKAYGQAKTSVMADNVVGLDFVRRLRAGFADLTFDPSTALLGAAGSALGGLFQGSAASSAAGQAAGASNAATQAQLQMFNTQNQQQQPYRQAGYNALDQLLSGFGLATTGAGAAVPGAGGGTPISMWGQTINGPPTLANLTAARSAAYQANYGAPEPAGLESGLISAALPDAISSYNAANPNGAPTATTSPNGINSGYFAHQFNAGDLNANLAPNYAFQLAQGQGAAQNALNLTGGLGGNFAKGLEDYTQNFAGNAYQNAFNNYTANQSNIFNRLSSIAGLGQSANTQSAGLAGSLAPSIAQTTQAAGAAQAAGTVGQANALAGGANNALGWYSLGNLINPGASGATGGGGFSSGGTYGQDY